MSFMSLAAVQEVTSTPSRRTDARPSARRRRSSNLRTPGGSRAAAPHPGSQDPTAEPDRRAPVFLPMIVDGPDHHFDRWSSSAIEKYALPCEELVRLAQLTVLALQRLHLLTQFGREARTLASVDLGLLDPIVQGLRQAANRHRDRHHRLPTRRTLNLVVEN